MFNKGSKTKLAILTFGLALIMGAMALPTQVAAGDTLIMNINREGTVGYAIGTTIAKTIGKYSSLKISGIPYSSPVAGFRDAGDGKCDIPYGSSLDLWQAQNSLGPFAKTPLKNKIYQGFYIESPGLLWITRADRDDINTLSDINGKKIFPGKTGSGISEGFKYMLKAMNIKIGKDVQMSYMDAANALKTGVVDVVGIYVIPRVKAVPGWVKNIDSQVKIKIIEPRDTEVKRLAVELAKYGIGFEKMPPFLKQLQGTKSETTWMGTQWWGWQFAAEVSADDAYNFVKTLFSAKAQADFKKGHKFLSNLADPEVARSMQPKGINAVVSVPVHPGVARYLKEAGLWQDGWKVGK